MRYNESADGLNELEQVDVELLGADGHLRVLEGVLDTVIRVALVDLLHRVVDRGLLGVGDEEELCA